MGLTIYGRFSEADGKLLEGIYSGVFTVEDGELEDGAHSERERKRRSANCRGIMEAGRRRRAQAEFDRMRATSKGDEAFLTRLPKDTSDIQKMFESIAQKKVIQSQTEAKFEADEKSARNYY